MIARPIRGLLAAAGAVACAATVASASHTYYDIDHPPDPLNYPRRQPPEEADTVFVVNPANLEQQCYFSTGGPMLVNLEIDRHVGNVQKLLETELIKKEAILKLHVFDIEGPLFGEFHKVYFNDLLLTVLPDGTETGMEGSNCWWTTVTYRVPVDAVNFATLNPSGPPTSGQNEIRIEIDTESPTPTWCLSLDWVALEIRVANPVILVHGIRSSGAAWAVSATEGQEPPWHEGLLLDFGLPETNDLNMGEMDWIQSNAVKIMNT